MIENRDQMSMAQENPAGQKSPCGAEEFRGDRKDTQTYSVEEVGAYTKDSGKAVVAAMSDEITEEDRKETPKPFRKTGIVERKRIPTSFDPSIMMEVKLYAGSCRKQAFRAFLSVPGSTLPEKEHYCDSMKEAIAWAKKEGEDALFGNVNLAHFRTLPQKLRLGTAYRVMRNTQEAAIFREYFESNSALLERLSEKPLLNLTVEDCGLAVQELFKTEEERARAVRNLNRLLGLCYIRGMRSGPLRLKYNERKHDRHLRAMRLALKPRVFPDDLARKLYRISRDKMKENPLYLAILLQLTMGLAVSEVAALQYRDICGEGSECKAEAAWHRPEGEVWYLKIRRFSKRTSVPGKKGYTTKCVVTKTENVFKYRLMVIPQQMREALEEYLPHFSDGALGETFLIPGQRANSVTADNLRTFTKKVLAECGVKELAREAFLPSIDGIRKDALEKLAPTLTIFQSNLEFQMDQCGFGPHEVNSYLGKGPVAVLDDHYWESKTRMAQLRQLRKLDRWGLQECAAPEINHLGETWTGQTMELPIHAHPGKVSTVSVTVTGESGCPVCANLSVPYGFDCQYVVTHSEEPVKS